jgi:MFS family permease
MTSVSQISHLSKHATPRSRLPRAAAFWLTVGATVVLLGASSAPSPLYPLYQTEFRFSSATLTLIFAIYVLALLLSLLTVGRLSDFVGRRPVLAASLAAEVASLAVFLAADGVGWLLVARLVQGFATGAAIGVLGAYLLDLQPPDRSGLGSLLNATAPTAGLGVGAIGTGLLVQYEPAPTRLVYLVLLALTILLAVAVSVLPETVGRTSGALRSLRPTLAVPSAARRAFAGTVPTLIASWALSGLMLSVGGSLVVSVFGQTNEAVVGLLVGAFALSGAVAAMAVTRLSADLMSRIGITALVVGTAVFVLALLATSLALFVLAVVVTGSGFGTGVLGAMRSVTHFAQPHERAALLSALYVVSYLAFSIPAVISGILITQIGLRSTALCYAILVGLLALGRLLAIPVRTPAD